MIHNNLYFSMKTKAQIKDEITVLAKKLKPLSKAQFNKAVKLCFDFRGVTFNRKHVCLECLHTWKHEPVNPKKNSSVTCPACNKKLLIRSHSCFSYLEYAYVDSFEIIGDYQVYRLISLKKIYDHKRTVAPYVNATEVLQFWLNLKEGKSFFNIRPRANCMGSMYFDNWAYNKDLAVREDINYNLATLRGFVRIKTDISIDLIRRGFDSSWINSAVLFNKLNSLNTPIAETLYKVPEYGLYDLLITRESKRIVKYWNSIKIAFRHGKRDFNSDWFDYLDLMKYFKKDLNSPALLIPKDFHLAHNVLVKRKRKIDDIKNAERLRIHQEHIRIQNEQAEQRRIDEAIKHEKKYIKEKKKFFGLSFTDSNLGIEITPLKSVDEFKIHTDTFNHCVWTNGYFKRINSLICAAVVNGKLKETIEIDLVNLEVVQSRGKCNNPTKYNKAIIDLVNTNMSKIKALL